MRSSRTAVANGWSGIEALSGIPGRTGATPVQNVGAYGQDVSQTVASVRVLDRADGEVRTLDGADCGFGYRMSRFKADAAGGSCCRSACASTSRAGGVVRYAELARALGVGVADRAPVADIRDRVLALRSRKGMVLDDADPDTWSAGSFFTNPVVDDAVALRIPEGCPRYPSAFGTKLSAAWLIENAGIGKGFALSGRRRRPSRASTPSRSPTAAGRPPPRSWTWPGPSARPCVRGSRSSWTSSRPSSASASDRSSAQVLVDLHRSVGATSASPSSAAMRPTPSVMSASDVAYDRRR